jgi:hypothetical protein
LLKTASAAEAGGETAAPDARSEKRRVDAVNQIIVAKWFWQVANDSETEGLGSNIFVRLSGNQNGGNAAAKRLEAAM